MIRKLVCIAFCLAPMASSWADLEYHEVARTGEVIDPLPAAVASFGSWGSINDAGQVGFKVTLADGSEAIVRATPHPRLGYRFKVVETGDGTNRQFGDYVGINANGEASYRMRTAAAQVQLSIRRNQIPVARTGTDPKYYFSGLMAPTDVSTAAAGMVSFYCMVLEGTKIRHQIRKGDGSGGTNINYPDVIATQPTFTSLSLYTSINDTGLVAFHGIEGTLGEGIFVGEGAHPPQPPPPPWVVATTNTFVVLGTNPTINNHNAVAFYGERGTEKGVFVTDSGGLPQLTVALGDDVLAIPLDQRIVLNNSGLLAFAGDGVGHKLTLFRADANGVVPIVAVGDSINASPPITDLVLWDGLNDYDEGEIVFWARHEDRQQTYDAVYVHGYDPHVGFVEFADANHTPISGARVYAYRLNGGSIERIDPNQPSLTDVDGFYKTPTAFLANPTERLSLLAEIDWTDPGTGQQYPVVNYVNDDPYLPADLPVPAPVGTETILVPLPVVLQAGWKGSTRAWDAFGSYLRSDAGATGLKNTHIRGQTLKLPAFITLTMPNDEEQAWGYDQDAPMKGAPDYDHNTQVLIDFVITRASTALQPIIADVGQRDRLPVHLCGYSMGGPITRAYLAHDDLRPVHRYVSLDGHHGATNCYYVGCIIRGWAEWHMNGVNDVPMAPPAAPGWNYLYDARIRGEYLLLSSSTDGVVAPNCSALGVGRTMTSALVKPNGHRERFVGGWEWHTPWPHSHGVTEQDSAMKHSARFFATGNRPDDQLTWFVFKSVPGDAYACIDDPFPDNEGPAPGLFGKHIEAAAGESEQLPVGLDATTRLNVSVLAEPADATFDLLGPSQQSLIPSNHTLTEMDDGWLLTFEVEGPPVGEATIELVAGTRDSSAVVTLAFNNGRHLQLELPADPLAPGESATILASLRDKNSNVIIGTGGTVEVAVTDPELGTQSLQLFDDGAHGDGGPGDGVYGNWYNDTHQGGRYVIDGRARVDWQSEVVERTGSGFFVVDSSPGAIVGVSAERPVDGSGNGKYDRLEFDINLAFSESGTYQLRAVLDDAFQNTMSSDRVNFEIPPEGDSQLVTLQFSSADIVAHGEPGPWTLARIALYDSEQVLLVDTLPDWTTAAYQLDEFDPPAPPLLLRASPNYGPYTGGNEVVLQGAHLEYVTAIRVGTADVMTFETLSGSAVRMTVPPSPGGATGSVDVSLETAWANEIFEDAYEYVFNVGDLNCDAVVGFGDINPFILALANPHEYARRYPDCPLGNRDINGNGTFGFDDVNPFVKLLASPY